LVDTMSFVDALPSLRARQGQLMVLVLLYALSIHRLPCSLSHHVKLQANAEGIR
jgi:hypothetical protein